MDSVFKVIEIVGTSKESYEKAINNGITKASETIKAISWFEVVQQRGAVKDGKVCEFQVVLKVGFKLID
ncbi:MAG TPA: dodecin domain-containing protein [Caldithrix sp.]|nr:dodecin domain-containing protein [Caldithrix sp.]